MDAERLPPVGLGTLENDPPEQCARTVADAIDMGNRRIDTARFYSNERAVGEGIAAADRPREELFVASKLHPFAEGLAAEEVHEGARESPRLLDLERLDLLYVRWPVGNYDPAETLEPFDDLVADGLVEHVGISNFDAA